jgi:hypothetical protein
MTSACTDSPRTAPRVLAVVLLAAEGAARAEPDEEPEKIRDNLFLLEEAYNQEPGVIQHIQSFMVDVKSKAWSYSFTEEWPAPTDRHQLSITVPAFRPDEDEGGAGAVGDILLNYRLQAVGVGGAGWLAMAPRMSLVLPTGDYRTGAGRGVLGLQLNLPTSIEIGDELVTHVNAGLTITPGARSHGGSSGTALDANAGVAVVWLPLSRFNPLVEIAFLSTQEIRDDGTRSRTSVLVVNPGTRAAINFRSGLQVVPGISAPMQTSGRGTTFSVLAYLSFEHRLWNQPGDTSMDGATR